MVPAWLRNAFFTGNAAGLAAITVAMLAARRERGRAGAVLNPVSHIWTGLPALPHALVSTHRHATIGLALHQGASVFWAAFFERLYGRRAERSTPPL